MIPQKASANILSVFTHTAQADTTTDSIILNQSNSQKMTLAEANMGPNNANSDNSSLSSVSITDTTLTPKVGPLGSNLDVAQIITDGQMTIYTVHSGDTLSSLAEMFDVSANTIAAINNLRPSQPLKTGMILSIPPRSQDLAPSNQPTQDTTETHTQNPKSSEKSTKNKTVQKNTSTIYEPISPVNNPDLLANATHPLRINDKRNLGKALLRPVDIDVSRLSQGAHNPYGSAVDLAAPIGTPIYASADATVVVATTSGWNGGYGEYVIMISNIDGGMVQVIDAHMSKVLTKVGDHVARGQIIGEVGETGDATGPHVHFEVYGALNPITINKDYTGM